MPRPTTSSRPAQPLADELLPVLDLEERRASPPKCDGALGEAVAPAAWRSASGSRRSSTRTRASGTSAVGNAPGFERYPLWLANYGKDDGKVYPVRTVGSWPSIAVHQYTSKGRIAGWDDPVDLNRLKKGWTLDLLRLESEPPPGPGLRAAHGGCWRRARSCTKGAGWTPRSSHGSPSRRRPVGPRRFAAPRATSPPRREPAPRRPGAASPRSGAPRQRRGARARRPRSRPPCTRRWTSARARRPRLPSRRRTGAR